MKRCSLRLMACGATRHPEFMTRKKASLCPVDFPSFVGLITHPDEGLILFDTGYDAAFFEATQPFPERFYRWVTPIDLKPEESAAGWLKRLGYKREDVRAIIISHFHGDHVAGLHQFPNAKIYCSRIGLNTLRNGGRFKRVRQGLLSSLVPNDLQSRATFFEDYQRQALPSALTPFSMGVDLFGDQSLMAIELPGHCVGHWGLALRIQDDRVVFLIADASWSITSVEEDCPPPKITTALLGNTKRYRSTLAALHEIESSKRDVVILPSHCPVAAQRFERKER